jgi:hypothetical protein
VCDFGNRAESEGNDRDHQQVVPPFDLDARGGRLHLDVAEDDCDHHQAGDEDELHELPPLDGGIIQVGLVPEALLLARPDTLMWQDIPFTRIFD